MELDATGTLEFEIVLLGQHSYDTAGSFKAIKCLSTYIIEDEVFVVIIDSTYPNAWISKRWKEFYVLQA